MQTFGMIGGAVSQAVSISIRAVEATQALCCHFVCYIACIFTSAYDARPVYITRGCSSVFLRL